VAKILLVDDDVDLVEMYRLVLVHRGHNVLVAYTAAEARKLLEAGPPDVAILDVMMESETAGFHLALELHERFPKLPAVILSGIHSAMGVPFRFEVDPDWLPVVKFIDKPAAPAALADEVEAILRK